MGAQTITKEMSSQDLFRSRPNTTQYYDTLYKCNIPVDSESGTLYLLIYDTESLIGYLYFIICDRATYIRSRSKLKKSTISLESL